MLAQEYLYDNGTPFNDWKTVEENIDDLILRKNERKPCLIIEDGSPSTGKTTKAIHIANAINIKHGLPTISLVKEKNHIQVGRGVDEFIAKLRPCAEAGYPVIIFDEAGEYNKRGWNTKLNRLIDRIMDTYRAYNIIIIMIMHDFKELPKHVWNIKLPTMLIHLKERVGNTGKSAWYDLEDMFWIMYYAKTEVFPERAFDRVSPVFRCDFKNLSPEESHALDLFSTAQKKEKLMGTEIQVAGLLSIRDIITILGRSEAWIKQTIKKLKIKEQRTYKKRKYYPQETIAKLTSQIKK